MRQWEKERVRGKDGRLVVLRNSVLRVEGGRMRTKGRRRGSGPAREMCKGADDKTEVPAYQMLQCKLSAHSRRIRTKLSRDSRSHVFLKEIEKKVIKKNQEIKFTSVSIIITEFDRWEKMAHYVDLAASFIILLLMAHLEQLVLHKRGTVCNPNNDWIPDLNR